MTWTDIPDASLDPGKPARSIDAKALRDNIAHVRDGNNLLVVFTASGTYTKPAGLKRVKVTVVGGGGGSGGAKELNSSAGYSQAGGGGGAASKVIEAASLGATETVTVGVGGSSGASTPAAGGAGGTSSFGAHCSATGGAGGIAGNDFDASAFSAAPGIGSGGDVIFRGAIAVNGEGGGGCYGGCARNAGPTIYGSGGGSRSAPSNTSIEGINGAIGIVIVEEFY